MQRTAQIVFVTLAVSVAASVALTRRGQATESPAQEAIHSAVSGLGLYAAYDPPNRERDYKIILSERPLAPDWPAQLIINHPDFARWQGTVAVYVGQPEMVEGNTDPEHPERYAVWAGSFVYGDPALIDQLRVCPP